MATTDNPLLDFADLPLFDRIRPAQAIGIDADVDHGNRDLRLLLARDDGDRNQADNQRGEQE